MGGIPRRFTGSGEAPRCGVNDAHAACQTSMNSLLGGGPGRGIKLTHYPRSLATTVLCHQKEKWPCLLENYASVKL